LHFILIVLLLSPRAAPPHAANHNSASRTSQSTLSGIVIRNSADYGS